LVVKEKPMRISYFRERFAEALEIKEEISF
jgi:hypothetical protein